MTPARATPSKSFQLDPAVPGHGLSLWVVPHTHWDREWYLTFEEYRLRLVEVVDRVLEQLATDPAFRFTLDGQAVVLEDYLSIRPARAPELQRRIAEGRLSVGPLYTLPDEYLVGAESLVRNLLVGRETCWQRGARPSSVGYLPDTFGHVAQMPQLLRGFGIDSFIFTRGLGNEGRRLGALFTWRAPDGSEVLAVPQLGGYHNAPLLGHGDAHRAKAGGNDQTPAQNAWRTVEQLLCSARYRHHFEQTGLTDVLLANGMDHEMPQSDLADVLQEMDALVPGHSYHVATYEEYVARVRERHGEAELQPFSGELCGGLWENVLRGVNSTRMHLKQANERIERELQAAETLAALATLRDASYRYPLEELRQAWRELLRNHPHDSICGCSIDEVHRDMHQRFVSAGQIAAGVTRRATTALAGTRDPWNIRPYPGRSDRPELVPMAPTVYNVLGHERTRLVDIQLPPILEDGDLTTIMARVDDGAPRAPQFIERDGLRFARLAVNVPALGTASVKLQLAEHGARAALPAGASRLVDNRTIENGHYRVHVADDGSLTISELASGREVTGAGTLEDVGDCGDEYTFCGIGRDETVRGFLGAEGVTVLSEGPEVAELELRTLLMVPAGLVDDRSARSTELVPIHATTVVSLTADVARVDFTTTLTNTACDHRLRVRFPARGAGAMQQVRAEGHFLMAHRPAVPEGSPDWYEPPHTTHHTLGAVAWGDSALCSRGLPEYEAVPSSGELALTLLRCVGWLSRDELPVRKRDAGPQIATPEAQCLGTHVFEYAFSLDGARTDAEIMRWSQDMRFDMVVGPGGGSTNGLVQLGGDGWVLSALKGAEDGVGVVLRACNPAFDVDAKLGVAGAFRRIVPARLDETMPSPTARASATVNAGEIRTLRLLS